ncbi:flagellar export chaperone FliS [Fictibacillus sp. KIGAM418]|uniref:Flagellar secretion chaperone FliS n=1 Tax=Fictibacillus marinisediminis TaxID=2878389 RepID=A0A9X2BGW4_9BACL|nr:flagellar export chaperone FliS [Fictibacillus marinisediminis]MCK6258672.1 flagellar export chaperone FliS [Fictibacillus marinisediminis]
MSLPNPYQSYQNNSVQTASPGELTLMLYNGCLKFITQAKQAIHNKNLQEKNTNCLKAQKIIQELMVTLNMDAPVSQTLMPMYDYLNRLLIDANVQGSIEILDEVESFVTEFRDTWKEVIQINRRQQYGQGGRV